MASTMDGAMRVEGPSSSAPNLTLHIGFILLLVLFTPRLSKKSDQSTILGVSTLRNLAIVVPTCLSIIWLHLVLSTLTEPYLDEVFHIPQAQKYCAGRFRAWDPKLTTPPGLYIYSFFLEQLQRLPFLHRSDFCSDASLRTGNSVALLGLGISAALCRHRIEGLANPLSSRPLSTYAIHTAVNISLFPVLFFLSALYYTDDLSTLVVLIAFWHQLSRLGLHRESGFPSDLTTIILGVAALFMRQTNVFWVVVFFGGLEAVDALKPQSPPRQSKIDSQTSYANDWSSQLYSTVSEWASGNVHDVSLNRAWPHDLLICLMSLGVAAVSNPLRITKRIWPHLAVMGLFVLFVYWNGGVVLGDKDNHIATIHTPQLLYIWPFVAFFSAPLFIQRLVVGIRCLSTASLVNLFSRMRWYYPFLILALVGCSLLSVKFNTIIHPFTLADNRHYMFYVFRLTIRKPGMLRYLLVSAYGVCFWFVWDALSASRREEDRDATSSFLKSLLSHPSGPPINPPKKTTKETLSDELEIAYLDDNSSFATEPTSASTALLLLVATSLSLVTAPLVEPRYFIIPWVMWRLLVPAWRPQSTIPTGSSDKDSACGFVYRHDFRLLVETAWFLVISGITCYIFLQWPFVWQSDDGVLLDGGRTQRFMW